MRVLAVIPARGGSKGLPGKNIRLLCGKPLIAWSIETALACPSVDRIVVSTDSSEIAAVAADYGAPVPFLRPPGLSGDSASSVGVVLHALDFLRDIGESYDLVAVLEPTSPLRDVSDVEGALEMIGTGRMESVIGVAKPEASHPSFLFVIENGLLASTADSEPTGLRRQDLKDEYYYPEGSIYVTRVNSLRKNKTFYPSATAPFLVDRYKAIEVDEVSDFISVEALMTAKLAGKLG